MSSFVEVSMYCYKCGKPYYYNGGVIDYDNPPFCTCKRVSFTTTATNPVKVEYRIISGNKTNKNTKPRVRKFKKNRNV